MRALLVLFAFALQTFAASPIIFGARGGASVSDSATSLTNLIGSSSLNRNFVVGPTLGVRLPLGFSVEGDALFTRESLNFGRFAGFSANTHSDSWEFPVMLKFAAGRGVVAPVVGAGVTVRHINNFGDVPSYLFTGSTESNSVGFVASGGLRFQAGAVSITPEARYTRWNGGGFTQSLIDVFGGSRNQIQALVGITF